MIEQEYTASSAAAKNHAIAGLSMGGGHALQIGLNHLDQFSARRGLQFRNAAGRSNQMSEIRMPRN